MVNFYGVVWLCFCVKDLVWLVCKVLFGFCKRFGLVRLVCKVLVGFC